MWTEILKIGLPADKVVSKHQAGGWKRVPEHIYVPVHIYGGCGRHAVHGPCVVTAQSAVIFGLRYHI
jgi:hypothetical protein